MSIDEPTPAEKFEIVRARLGDWTVKSHFNYYALYQLGADSEILSKDRFINNVEEVIATCESTDYYGGFKGYKTIKEAKDYLKMHINGELMEARRSLTEVNAIKAKDLK